MKKMSAVLFVLVLLGMFATIAAAPAPGRANFFVNFRVRYSDGSELLLTTKSEGCDAYSTGITPSNMVYLPCFKGKISLTGAVSVEVRKDEEAKGEIWTPAKALRYYPLYFKK